MSTIKGPKALPSNTLLAGAAVTRYRFIKKGADDNTGIHAAAAADIITGISMDNQDNVGKTFPILDLPGQQTKLQVGAAVASGARLTSDATGRGVAAATGNRFGAVAEEAATAADQLISVHYVDSTVATAP